MFKEVFLLRYWKYLRNQWFLRVSSCLKQTEDTLLCCLIKRQLTYPNWTWAWNKFSLSLSPFQCIIDFFQRQNQQIQILIFLLFVFVLLVALFILVSLLLARVGSGEKNVETGSCGYREKLETRICVEYIRRTLQILKNFFKTTERFVCYCFSFVRRFVCVWENFIQLE